MAYLVSKLNTVNLLHLSIAKCKINNVFNKDQFLTLRNDMVKRGGIAYAQCIRKEKIPKVHERNMQNFT